MDEVNKKCVLIEQNLIKSKKGSILIELHPFKSAGDTDSHSKYYRFCRVVDTGLFTKSGEKLMKAEKFIIYMLLIYSEVFPRKMPLRINTFVHGDSNNLELDIKNGEVQLVYSSHELGEAHKRLAP